jgi:lipopolysaccharide biosynthesis regulator YciM
MDFDLNWVLMGLPIAFVLGWLASRFDLRQMRLENRQAPKAYFKGLNFLLNEQQDQAIDAFIEAVQSDPDTSELHFALGNLFRRRGEYERAVRVHQHLLSRGDISADDRHRAQHGLALDYLKAGLLDRAETALLALEGTRFEAQARLALLANYERSRDWAGAAQVAAKLESAGQGSFAGRLAHYLCEQAAAAVTKGDITAAKDLLQQAIASAPHSPRARTDMARLCDSAGNSEQALAWLEQAAQATPASLPLMASMMARCALASGRGADISALLQQAYAQAPSLDVLDAIVQLENAANGPQHDARNWYVQHLEKQASLVAATQWIAGEKLENEQFHPQVQRALDQAVKPLKRYRCAACGFEAQHHFWHCPGCQAWDSYPPHRVEEL